MKKEKDTINIDINKALAEKYKNSKMKGGNMKNLKDEIKNGMGAFVVGVLVLCFVAVLLVIAVAPRYNRLETERDDYHHVAEVLLQGKILHYQIYPDSIQITYTFK